MSAEGRCNVMSKPRALVLRSPGTNCDHETAFAFEQAGAVAERIHINRLKERPTVIQGFDICCLAGGFSYGDDIAAGRILAQQLRQYLNDALLRFRDDGKLVLGICNGFQALLQTDLLIANNHGAVARATLALNDSGRYEDRWVHLSVQAAQSPFLAGLDRLYLPVAHAEGKFVTRDKSVLRKLRADGQIALTYSSRHDQGTDVGYPENPNGSVGNIAGICDPTGRVLGLMPHPERFLHRTHHPHWTRSRLPEAGDGWQLFANAVASVASV